MPCDIRDAQQIAAFVSATKAALGSIDILVNNAGGSAFCRRHAAYQL